MKKLLLIPLILIVFLFSLFYVNADNCGGFTPCSCEDTVTSSYTLNNDLNCNTAFALKIYFYNPGSNLILNCNNHTISQIGSTWLNNGIYMDAQNNMWYYNITIRNCVIKNFSKGVYIDENSNLELTDIKFMYNSFINNKDGIYIPTNQDYGSGKIFIEKNSFFKNGGIMGFLEVGSGAINIRNADLIDIKYNCIINNTGYGIYIDYPSTYLSDIRINYNVIDNNYYGTNYKYPGDDYSEIGFCFSNDGSYCRNLNLENFRFNVTHNYWNYSGDWLVEYLDPECDDGEVKFFYDSNVQSNSYCCPFGTTFNDVCNTGPYLNSNPIPGWEICTDGVDNDCDHLIDLADPDCFYCGNGQVEPSIGEQCDPGPPLNLNGKDCTNYNINSPYAGGNLLCYTSGPNKCHFNTQQCCGGTGYTCSPANAIDGCCTASEAPPTNGFMCRYYEGSDPPVNPPYSTKCCENGLQTYSNCVWSMYDPTSGPFTYTTCVPQGQNNADVVCCNSPADCVYNGLCYDNNTLSNIYTGPGNTGLEHCTNNHWCPEGFYYNAIQNRCQTEIGDVCHVGTENNFCIISTFPYYNLLNPFCIEFGPINNPPSSLPYEESCCFKIGLGIMNYYEWKDIVVYSSSGGGGWSQGQT
ncbi:MAG: right-handed parallel beta-helix repeat-containing protein [archaeon]